MADLPAPDHTPDPPAVRTELDGAILHVTLDRPGKKNALTQPMYGALADALIRAEDDTAIRVVLLTAAGDAFCAGNDLDDFDLGADGESQTVRFLNVIARATVPIVMAVQGVAVGVGTTMLLHADLVHASTDARFRLPFVDLGLVPEAGSTLLLPQLVGHRRAADLLYTGRFFSAAEAQELGIVNTVVEREALAATATETAANLAAKPPGALRRTKALLRSPATPLAERMAVEGKAFVEQLRSPEFAEARAAFFERRPPTF
jgi:enoyl-CoA hydratase/carnithine racemase